MKVSEGEFGNRLYLTPDTQVDKIGEEEAGTPTSTPPPALVIGRK